eukprot:13029799-Alexandrium_andersonii.AAC.1
MKASSWPSRRTRPLSCATSTTSRTSWPSSTRARSSPTSSSTWPRRLWSPSSIPAIWAKRYAPSRQQPR